MSLFVRSNFRKMKGLFNPGIIAPASLLCLAAIKITFLDPLFALIQCFLQLNGIKIPLLITHTERIHHLNKLVEITHLLIAVLREKLSVEQTNSD